MSLAIGRLQQSKPFLIFAFRNAQAHYFPLFWARLWKQEKGIHRVVQQDETPKMGLIPLRWCILGFLSGRAASHPVAGRGLGLVNNGGDI